MSLLSLVLNRRTPGKIGKIDLDATIQDTHEYANKVTEFPVEDGSVISDHIISEPVRLSINGFVTNSPVSLLGVASNILNGLGTARVQNAFDELLRLQEGVKDDKGIIQRELITVVTGLRVYTNMVMVSLSVPRDRTTGDSLRFSAEFRKIEIAKSEFVAVENLKTDSQKTGPSTVAKGRQTPGEASAETQTATRRSWAKSGLDSLKSGIFKDFL